MNKLPSRQVTAVLVVAIAVIVSAVIIVRSNAPKEDTSLSGTGTTTSLINIPQNELEINASGTPAWQKNLTGLSITDNGTSTKNLSGTSTPQVLTVTDAISRDLFARYAATQTDGSVDASGQQAIVDQLMKNYSVDDTQPTYTVRDIKVEFSTTPESIKKYGNTFALIERTRLALMVEQLKKNSDPKIIADAHRKISQDLLQVSAPAPIAEIHLEAVNSYEKTASSLEDLVNYESDPVRGLFALKIYRETESKRLELYTQIASYLKKSGILFDENEPGYAWMAF